MADNLPARPRYRVKAGSALIPTEITRAVPAKEGEYRPGPYYLPVTGGWLSAEAGSYWNWWQLGYSVGGPSTASAMIEACVSAYAQTVAMCLGAHWRLDEDNGGRDRIITSSLSRVLRRPNAYQSNSDFSLNAVRELYLDGNAYALALRNDRFEIAELHLMRSRQCAAHVAPTGDIFYSLSGNEVIERQLHDEGSLLVPARDVLHIKLHTPRHPLKGVSPIMAVMMDLALGDALLAQQIQFYSNMARPSTVLTTDLVLDKDQVNALRDRWNEQARGLNTGGTPILTAGLKPHQLSTPAVDSQLAEVLKLTEQHIAMAFRIPLQILGIGGAPYGSTEVLMQAWIASGLGFCLNHVEEAFGNLFNLRGPPEEYVEFDTSALLRSAFKDRIEGMARAVQSGIFAPNEARETEGLPRAKEGDEPRVQQQVVPLSAWAQTAKAMPAAPPKPPFAAPAAPPKEEQQSPPPKEGRENVEQKHRELRKLRSRFRASQTRHLAV